MYIPSQFMLPSQDLLAVIRKNNFGALIIFSQDKFFTSHLPFIVKEYQNTIELECHVAKANEIWKVANPSNKSLVIFQGAHTYIHPGWYANKKTGKVVPTYNYQSVHCHGFCTYETSEEWLIKHLAQLTEHHEHQQTEPWHINNAPQDFIKALTKGIVGIKFHIQNMEGALKMNQHHTKENRLAVIDKLSQSTKQQDRLVSKIMQDLQEKS